MFSRSVGVPGATRSSRAHREEDTSEFCVLCGYSTLECVVFPSESVIAFVLCVWVYRYIYRYLYIYIQIYSLIGSETKKKKKWEGINQVWVDWRSSGWLEHRRLAGYNSLIFWHQLNGIHSEGLELHSKSPDLENISWTTPELRRSNRNYERITSS